MCEFCSVRLLFEKCELIRCFLFSVTQVQGLDLVVFHMILFDGTRIFIELWELWEPYKALFIIISQDRRMTGCKN